MRLHKVACKRLFARCPHCNTPVLKDEIDEHIKFAHPPEVKKAEVTEVQKPAEEPVTQPKDQEEDRCDLDDLNE